MSGSAKPLAAKAIDIPDGVLALKEFFARMSQYCASVDFDSTEVLFAPDVVSFGTKADVVRGLRQLRSDQWEHIWPNIEGFEMQLDKMEGSADGHLAWGMLPWLSKGFDTNGNTFARPGRATAILERRNDRWLCVHTHFSLAPSVTPSGS